MEDPVSIATRAAIKRAKRRKSPKVTRDDLLVGLFQVIARFDIVQIGPLAIDLEELGEASQDVTDKTNKQKVAYSSKAAAVFERAAHIARKENSPKVELVHLLVAFAYEDNGLMAQLKEKYGLSSTEWRSALSKWQPISFEKRETGSEIGARRKSPMELNEKQFFSPDEAAEFLDVHTQTIRGYIRTGKLPALRLAGERALRIQRDDLLALLEPYKPEEK
ncbi:MAG: helix-turn-helix domain-containing protein [Desulfobacteraceae bacterium]|nr:helix-turn-helix domain-containing protein [Desulfobacteraceae bacterium]